MRAFVLIAVLAVFACSIHAASIDDYVEEQNIDDADTEVEEQTISVPDEMSVEEACMPQMCARLYEPFCVAIDGATHTASSDCVFDGQLRCLLAKARGSEHIPKVEFLYEGKCISPNFEVQRLQWTN